MTIVCNVLDDDLYNPPDAHYARPDAVLKVMVEVLWLFTQIALLRRGPQDLPAAPVLLALTVVLYFFVTFIVSAVLPPVDGPWVAHLVLDVVFTLFWYFLVLRLCGRAERIVQTITAVFGFQAVLSPALLLSGFLVRHFQSDTVWQFPVSLLGLGLLIWYIAANGHVVKAALEWSSPTSVALVILQILTQQLLVFAIFPGSA